MVRRRTPYLGEASDVGRRGRRMALPGIAFHPARILRVGDGLYAKAPLRCRALA